MREVTPKTSDSRILLLGVFCLVLGLALFGFSIFRVVSAHVVHKSEIKSSGKSSLLAQIDPSKLVQIELNFKISSPAHTIDGVGSDKKLKVLYAIPYEYSVTDSSGRLIHSQRGTIESDGMIKTNPNEYLLGDKGIALFATSLDKFEVPSGDGRIQIEISLGDDSLYSATVEKVDLAVYDNVSKHASLLGVAATSILVGFLIVMFEWGRREGPRSFTVTILLSFFLGSFGIDRFYLGHMILGVLKLATFGGCGLWYIVDMVLIATDKIRDFRGEKLIRDDK